MHYLTYHAQILVQHLTCNCFILLWVKVILLFQILLLIRHLITKLFLLLKVKLMRIHFLSLNLYNFLHIIIFTLWLFLLFIFLFILLHLFFFFLLISIYKTFKSLTHLDSCSIFLLWSWLLIARLIVRQWILVFPRFFIVWIFSI